MEDIIKKHLKRLNNQWLEKKSAEFKSSPLYDKTKDLIYHSEFVVKDLTRDIWDDEDNFIGEEIIDQIEFDEISKVSFREFCYKSNYYRLNNEYYPDWLAEIENLYSNKDVKRYLFGLNEVVEDVTIELGKYDSELTARNIRDFINRCKTIAEELIKDFLVGTEKIIQDLQEDLVNKFEAKLFEIYSNKIQINNIEGSNIDKLRIKLNTEDLSALLLLLSNANMIDLNKSTYGFFERHITLVKSNKPHSNTARQLEQRVSKIRNLGGLGINNIKEQLNRNLKL